MTDEVDVEYEEVKLPNGMFRVASRDVEHPRELTPAEKIALDRKNELLTQKAESRQEECWNVGCTRKAHVWVRHVAFDFKGPKADPINHLTISSSDYPGPVPGFCLFCIATGPKLLAERIYLDRPEITWGALPTRWVVEFTDGTKEAGSVATLEIKSGRTLIIE